MILPMRNAARIATLAFCFAGAPLACREKADPVRRTLDRLVQAAEKRDAQTIAEHLAGDFQAADGSGRADAQATLLRYLAAYEDLNVRLSDITIERGESAARVTFRADLAGKPRQIGGLEGYLPRSSAYRFELRLVPEGERWNIAWASWEPAEAR